MSRILRLICAATVFASIALVCAYPFIKRNSSEDDTLRDFAQFAAEAGFDDIAEECFARAKFDWHKSDINASIAFAKHKKGDETSAKKLSESAFFDTDSYLSRTLAYDILREPDWMKNLLEPKYLNDINSIRDGLKRTLPLYALSLKLGDSGTKYLDGVIKLLEGAKYKKRASDSAYSLAKLALDKNKPLDFLKLAKFLNTDYKNNTLIFEFLGKDENRKLWEKNKKNLEKHDYLRTMLGFVKQAVAKRDPNLIKNSMGRYPFRYDYNWRKTHFDIFNYPTKLYFTKKGEANELYEKYLRESLSPATMKATLASRGVYLTYAASVLATLGNAELAFTLTDYTNQSRERLMIFRAVIENMNRDRKNFETAREILFNKLI